MTAAPAIIIEQAANAAGRDIAQAAAGGVAIAGGLHLHYHAAGPGAADAPDILDTLDAEPGLLLLALARLGIPAATLAATAYAIRDALKSRNQPETRSLKP